MGLDIADRLKKELENFAPPGQEIEVNGIPDRKYGAWIGGSVLASTKTFSSLWITKKEFQEVGPQIIHQKCF